MRYLIVPSEGFVEDWKAAFPTRFAAQLYMDSIAEDYGCDLIIVEASITVQQIDHCGHGIPDGVYCEPCNVEYKRAAVEAATQTKGV